MDVFRCIMIPDTCHTSDGEGADGLLTATSAADRMVGNAVPPVLARAWGVQILRAAAADILRE